MRIFLLSAALFFFAVRHLSAQCNDLTALQVSNVQNEVLTANTECTDNEGWTHFYNSTNGKILLSVKSNGQNIGSLATGLTVKAGTLSGYGLGGYNLSDADYIDNDIWTVTQRFWQITGANGISTPVSVRFYFTGTDVADIANSVDDFGFFVDEPDDLLMYTISNAGGLDPLSVVTQPFNANFTLYDMVPGSAPDWTGGNFNGFPYGEFQVSTLDIAGGAGFLIFVPDDLLSISGNISKPNAIPVPDVTVQAATISVDVTDANGNYTCPTLLAGGNYEIVPTKDINHAEGISSADLIAISLHLLGTVPFSSPYQYIAADADKNAFISFNDIAQIRDVLLGNSPDFPNNDSWRFVPQTYVFPDPTDPFTPPFPEKITLNNLFNSLNDQDFIGVKTGDVVEPDPVIPPALNTTFSLQNLTTCNPGDTVKFKLTASDFQNIRAFQFTLEWDPSVMEFLNAGDFNLPGLTVQSIGDNAATDGKLTFVWFNPMTFGSSVANGAALCELRFLATGNIGNTTALSFNGSSTSLLLIHQNMSEVVPGTVPGSLSIQNTSGISGGGAILPASCSGNPTGAINLIVSGGIPPLSFLWSNGATTEDLTGVPGGSYQVTVTDGSGGCPAVFSFEIPLPPSVELSAIVDGMSCPYQVDGAINLTVGGGVAPFQYAWSNGKTTQDLSNLFQGTYSVTVTDALGCTGTATFQVTNLNKITPVVSIENATLPLSNGSVAIEAINGGIPPFSFSWSTGATTQSIVDLPAGDYVVTITDGVGCQHVFGYVVYSILTETGEVVENPVQANVYPNPVQAGQWLNLALESRLPGNAGFAVFTPEGKMVSLENFDMPSGQILKTFPAPEMSGLYFIRIQMDDFPAAWLKVMVR